MFTFQNLELILTLTFLKITKTNSSIIRILGDTLIVHRHKITNRLKVRHLISYKKKEWQKIVSE